MRVLVVEDEVELASLIRKGLREDGLLADVAIKGEDALWMAGAAPYDVIVLDVMLPGIDGFETCRRLRADEVWAPVLMLTARDAVEDRVAGLDCGAGAGASVGSDILDGWSAPPSTSARIRPACSSPSPRTGCFAR